MKSEQAFEKIEPERLEKFDERIKGVSEMTQSERFFLNGVIRHFRPKKLLEVGVAAGGSSAVILNAIQDIPEAKLFSHDYNADYYRGGGEKSGFLVNMICPELAGKWDLRTGGPVARHIDSIGGGIDFVLLDTMHSNPGEFLDFLMILPYLAKDAVLVIHDIGLHMGKHEWCQKCITCGVLFAALKGRKIKPDATWNDFTHEYMTDGLPLPNIGAVILESPAMDNVTGLFHLLSLPWDYLISASDFTIIRDHLGRHYDRRHVDQFATCYEHYRKSGVSTAGHTSDGKEDAKDRPNTKRIAFIGIPLIKIKSFGRRAVVYLFRLPLLKITTK